MPAAAGADVFLQGGHERRPRCLERRRQAAGDRRGHGDQQREQQDAHVQRRRGKRREDPVVVARRRDDCRRRAGEDLDAPLREQNAEGRGRDREQQRFGEELPHEPAAARTDREPHGHFSLARPRPGEQQSRHVHARDEQHTRCGSEQHEHRAPERRIDARVADRQRHRAPSGIARAVGVGEPRTDRRQRGVGLPERRARAQPRDDADEMLRRRQIVRVDQPRRERARDPHVRLAVQPRERRRQHAGNRQRVVVQADIAPDD